MRKRLTAALLLAIIALASITLVSVYTRPQQKNECRAEISSNAYSTGQNYLNLSRTYTGLGYPKLTHSGYPPYSPNKPNFTLEYRTKSGTFQVGTLQAPVLDLKHAVELAAAYAKLDPINYSLAEADFTPGTIVDSSLRVPAQWVLYFARAYDGYWLFGNYGTEAESVVVNINAFNGSVRYLASDLSNLPSTGHYKMKVNASQALQIAQSTENWRAVAALTKNCAVTYLDLRISLLGSSSNNYRFQHPLRASLDGQERLSWIINLLSPTPRPEYRGAFLVDAETGEILSEEVGPVGPSASLDFQRVSGSVDLTSAEGLVSSQETTQISGSVLGTAKSIPLVVPNVLVIRPGSTGSIDLNFSSNLKNVNVTVSFSNPLPDFETLSPDGLPAGVSARLTSQTIAVPGGGSTTDTLSISADRNAPHGTYLVEVDAKLSSPGSLGEEGTHLVLPRRVGWCGTVATAASSEVGFQTSIEQSFDYMCMSR